MDCYDKYHITLVLLLALFVTGCTTTTSTRSVTSVTRTIDSDTLQNIAEHDSGSDLQLNRGDTIDISLRIESELHSVYVKYLKINVTDVNTKTISGEVIDVHGQEGLSRKTKYKDITIMIKDIESISVYSTQHYTKDMEIGEYAEAFGWIFGLILLISVL